MSAMVCKSRKEMTLLVIVSLLQKEKAHSKFACPTAGSPVQTSELLATGRPRNSGGILFVFGARRRLMFHFKSWEASVMKSRQNSSSGRILSWGVPPSGRLNQVEDAASPQIQSPRQSCRHLRAG